jgi:hypothetical protein
VDWLRTSIAAKLDRADHHLGELRELVETGAVTDLFETRSDRDRKGRVRIRVKSVEEIPTEWSVWIGECVHDMRSALDHLAYGLNIIGSGHDPPPNEDSSQFPIYSTKKAYWRWRRARRRNPREKDPIGYFPRGARAQAERVQPYHGRKNNLTGLRRLADLAELSNIDKHRRFPITAWSPKRATIPPWIVADGILYPVEGYWPRHRLLKPDTTILWIEAPSLPASVEKPGVDFTLSAQIELEGASANPPVPLLMPHEPVAFTLDAILTIIRQRVLPGFQRFI